LAGYVELHIEQGPLLEAEGVPVGIVTAISGATRLLVRLTGFAGHAGTVPMVLRRDAGVAAAEMVLAVEEIALARPDIVVTVGKFSLSPGAVNVIPSGAEFTIDLRSPSDASRGEALAAIQARFADIAARREIGLSLKTFYEEHASTCDAALMDSLAAAVTAQGIAPRRLPSGAGHDGLAMSKLCPFAMLFVRCKGGISHNPAESVTAEDVGIAAQVLARFLQDYRPGL
jgi:allantoate deiminase